MSIHLLQGRLFLLAAAVSAVVLGADYASAGPVTTDIWDVAQGTLVTGYSAMKNGGPSDMFGAAGGAPEPGHTLFADGYPLDTIHWIEWQTASAVWLGSFDLYAAGDGVPPTIARTMNHFTLFARNPGTGIFETVYDTDVATPYSVTDDTTPLLSYALAAPIMAQEFRAEFRQGSTVTWAMGPRIIELDGFTPEPATLSLLGLGCLALLRRRAR